MNKRIVTSEIKKSLNQAVNQLPPPSFEKIANMPVVKMDRMDAITSQEPLKRGWLHTIFNPVQVRRLAAVCGCLFMILAVGAGGVYSYNNVVIDSVVDIDVNPAFELKINKKDKVLTFSPLNEEAVQAAKGLTYKGWNVEDAVKDLCRIMEENEYLTAEKRTVLISVENKNPDRVAQLQSRLSDCFRAPETEAKDQIRVVTQERKKDKAASRTAQDYRISAGKLQFIRTMTANYPDLDEKTLSRMTMEELYQIILEREEKKPEWLQMDEEDWEEFKDDMDDDMDDADDHNDGDDRDDTDDLDDADDSDDGNDSDDGDDPDDSDDSDDGDDPNDDDDADDGNDADDNDDPDDGDDADNDDPDDRDGPDDDDNHLNSSHSDDDDDSSDSDDEKDDDRKEKVSNDNDDRESDRRGINPNAGDFGDDDDNDNDDDNDSHADRNTDDNHYDDHDPGDDRDDRSSDDGSDSDSNDSDDDRDNDSDSDDSDDD